LLLPYQTPGAKNREKVNIWREIAESEAIRQKKARSKKAG
jgi:hypothetical protein